MIARTDLSTYLRRPVSDIPFETVSRDPSRTEIGDDPDVLFEEVFLVDVDVLLLFFFQGSIGSWCMDNILSRVEDESDAFF